MVLLACILKIILNIEVLIIQGHQIIYYIWFLILPGEHNATYTVAPSQEGLKFTKVRHGHPVQYARANYSKVTSDQPDCRQSEHGFSGHRHFGQPNQKVTRGQLNFQKSLGL